MTIPASSIPAALEALVSVITSQAQSDPEFSQILITLGKPGPTGSTDVIYITGDHHREVVPLGLIGNYGQGALYESYTLPVAVFTFANVAPELQASTVLTRAYQLVAFVEDAVRSNPTLNGIVEEAVPINTEGGEIEAVADPTGLTCTVVVNIQIRNAI